MESFSSDAQEDGECIGLEMLVLGRLGVKVILVVQLGAFE